jgi:hypothetical protein
MDLSPSGLPKVVGLEKVIENADDAINPPATDKDLQASLVPDVTAQQQEQTPPVQEGQVKEPMTDEEVLAQFKSTKDLLKSYKEIQGFTTRVSQENKEKAKQIDDLQAKLNQLQEELEIRRFQNVPQVEQQPQKTFEQLFIENPEQAIAIKAAEIANQQRIAEVLERKEAESPQEFHELLGYVKTLAQQPKLHQLSYSPKGVEKLFEIAGKVRKDQIARNAQNALKTIFGEDVDLEKFKAMVKKDPTTNTTNPPANPLNAYMPNTKTTTRTGADVDTHKNELEQVKNEAIKNGDANKVAGLLLKQALLK